MTSASFVRKAHEFGGSASANSVTLFTFDAELFDHVVMQLTGSFVATVTVEGSNDGTNWRTLPVMPLDTAAGVIVTTATAIGLFGFNTFTRYVRARTTAYTSGTVVASCLAEHGTLPFTTENVTIQALPASTQVIGATPLSASATVGVGTTSANVRAAASLNLTSVKASAAKLHGYTFQNTTAGAVFVKLYAKASAPVVASDIPAIIVHLPANSTVSYTNPIGKTWATGLAYAITGLIANTDSTAVTADSVVGHIDYV